MSIFAITVLLYCLRYNRGPCHVLELTSVSVLDLVLNDDGEDERCPKRPSSSSFCAGAIRNGRVEVRELLTSSARFSGGNVMDRKKCSKDQAATRL